MAGHSLEPRAVARLAAGGAVVLGCTAIGFLFGRQVGPVWTNRNLPWIIARATGIGAFVAMAVSAALGLWFRRPSKRRGTGHPETVLRAHAALGIGVAALVMAHIGALLSDRWAGVPWRALYVPNGATYRPGAVTYGVVAAYLLILVVLTASLAGRPVVRSRWALMHRLSYPAFAATWVHGVLAGSDTPRLRDLYIAAGVVVGLAALAHAWPRPSLAGERRL